MKTLNALKQYAKELNQIINQYNKSINQELRELDKLINREISFNNEIRTIDIINHSIKRDSLIESYIETIQDKMDIVKAKESKLNTIEKRINDYQVYMIQNHWL